MTLVRSGWRSTPGRSRSIFSAGSRRTPIPRLQLSVIGQKLLHDQHVEFGSPASAQAVERGVFAKAVWGF
jgi:hypothetical protein